MEPWKRETFKKLRKEIVPDRGSWWGGKTFGQPVKIEEPRGLKKLPEENVMRVEKILGTEVGATFGRGALGTTSLAARLVEPFDRSRLLVVGAKYDEGRGKIYPVVGVSRIVRGSGPIVFGYVSPPYAGTGTAGWVVHELREILEKSGALEANVGTIVYRSGDERIRDVQVTLTLKRPPEDPRSVGRWILKNARRLFLLLTRRF